MSTATEHRPEARSIIGWLWAGGRAAALDLARHWCLALLLAVIWTLALWRLFVDHVPLLPLLFNVTASVPYRVAWVDYGCIELRRGDYVMYAFAGPAARRDYPGLKGQAFFKQIAGMAGDRIDIVDRRVFVNGADMGLAKVQTFDRRPLQPIAPGRIPPGFFYVRGSHPDSFDSRYRSSGLVHISQVQARVIPLF